MTAKNKMIAIVGDAIVRTLTHYANTQPNLASDTTRHKIASDILDDVIRVLENPKFKK
jgi:hypothetical protein|tara:strand:- start:445 stop:618 length:174 start_codon:yes stop_codon:yes gene_type:complete